VNILGIHKSLLLLLTLRGTGVAWMLMELVMWKGIELWVSNRMSGAWGIPLAPLLLLGQFPEYKEWFKNYNQKNRPF
jgi:hypothetical protein